MIFGTDRIVTAALLALSLLLPNFAMAICGNGVRDVGEQCDDGNLINGDGCSLTCTIEPGFVCELALFDPFISPQFTDNPAPFEVPDWTLSTDRLGLTQALNSVATIYTSIIPADLGDIEFTIRAGTIEDDDFMGWTVGFRDGGLSGTGTVGDRDYLVFNWNQGAQNGRPPGLWLNRVSGPVTSSNGGGTLWTSTGNVQLLATGATFGSTGWDHNRAYRVRMRFTPTRMQVWLTPSSDLLPNGAFDPADEELEFDVSPCGSAFGTPCTQPNFPNGKFGFYAHSQEQTQFRLLGVNGSLGDVCGLDTDDDGIPDRRDLDSDGDGIPDLVEMPGFVTNPDFDSNGNGVPDWNDPLTIPGGCVSDGQVPARCVSLPLTYDRDQDGIPNHLDLDSDGDGLPDSYEAGLVDTDLDGLPDACTTVDDEGVCDDGGLVGPAPDTDNDGTPDFLDTDSDGDGIPDALEAFDTDGDQVANQAPNGTDTFGNGIDDSFDPRCTGNLCPVVGVISILRDTSGNGIPNHLQTCGDGYKIPVESCDDGNLVDGDGCSSTCTIEPGYQCIGTPLSVCTEVPPAVTVITPAQGTQTNDTTPELGGTTEPGVTLDVVVVDSNGQTVFTGSPTVQADGSWSIDSTPLIDGTYVVTATATRGNGTTASDSKTFTVDTVDPVVVIISPADQSSTPEVRPEISGTTEPGSTVEVTVLDQAGNTVFTTSVVADANGAWTTEPDSDLADGPYTVTALAVDPAGNTSALASNEFTVDTSLLTVDILTPTSGSTITETRPEITGTTEPNTEVTVVITDDAGDEVETLTTTSDENGMWSTTPTNPLDDGDYTASATVENLAGIPTTDTVDFTIDTAAPNFTFDSPENGTVVPSGQPVFSGTGEPGVDVTVEIFDEEGNLVETLTTTVDAMGMWSATPPAPLADGTYTATATGTDANGVETERGPNSFEILTTGPTVVITRPTDGCVGACSATIPGLDVTIAGTADPNATVEIFVDGEKVGETTADGNGDWTFVTPMSPGTHTIEATSTDEAGRTGRSNIVTITLVGNQPDPNAFYLAGNGCMSTGQNSGSGLLVLLGFMLVGLRRRSSRG